MSGLSVEKTPDEVVAEQIVARFVATGLLPEQYGEQTREQLANGKLKAEDWRLLAEIALEWQAREGDHGR